jgi:ParB family transcriptional regulator, chromosome partitioning protein
MNKIIEVEISKIKIKKRLRKQLIDIRPLMNSFKKFGQFTPIILNEKLELIAGNRRLEAAKMLGWQKIQAIIVDRNTEIEKLELELEENIQRRDLSIDEISDGFDRVNKLMNPCFMIKFFRKIKSFFSGKKKKI